MVRTFDVNIPDPNPGEKCVAYVQRVGWAFHDKHFDEAFAKAQSDGYDHELRHMTDSVVVKAIATWCDFNVAPMR